MSTIPVYKISTAKGKLPRDAEVDRDVNIDNGFAYARDLPKDQENCTYYAVTEDNDLLLFTIGDQVIAKEGTMLFMPESLANPTLPFQDLKTCLEQKGVIKVKALAMLPPPTQVNPV
ncbi:hypothetical protein ABBQ32_009963 [Trebouxia sp. C0010 RCD-2024]